MWRSILFALLLVLPVEAGAQSTSAKAFPGAQGWAATTPGGRGGRIIRVTTLDREGPGSFSEAVQAKGPRIIVFEVGGVIDLGGKSLSIREPFVTIAGQTAPSPGISFVRGGIGIQTHDVVVQHIRIRSGEAGREKKSGWEIDGLATSDGAYNVIVDHCSIAWATDENLSASGPRFEGATVEDWRKGTSHKITFSNNIIAEGLSNSTHAKGEHSKGSLIHDNATDILIVGNLYSSNVQRNPFFKGGARGIVANNLIYNPGNAAVHYTLVPSEWGEHPYVTGQMILAGNVLKHGPDTRNGLALFTYVGPGEMELYSEDNMALDRAGMPVSEVRIDERRGGKLIRLSTRPFWPEGLTIGPAAGVEESVSLEAGARPWDRDAIDTRIVRQMQTDTGKVIDSEQEVGGYPDPRPTRRAFDPAAWDLSTMTPKSGKY